MQNRAKRRIPGMTQLLSKRPDMFSYGVWPAYYQRARGAQVWDIDGNEYVDMSIGGIGANVLGYADPDVDAAVLAAIKDGSSSSLNCPEELELADLLCELHPWADMVRYTRSGGEAMAVAVRIARACTGRDQVAVCGYHGWHDWYLAANLGTKDALGEHLLPGLESTGVPRALAGTVHAFRYNNLGEIKAIFANHGHELAAVVLEPVRNLNPEAGFIEAVRSLTDKQGAVMIMDEISAGFRYNTGGAHMVLHQPRPDIAVFSKALGNGYPIAAIIGRREVMEAAQKTFISSTNWTERVGPAAALATIRKHREKEVHKHLIAIGEYVWQGWKESAKRHSLRLDVGGMIQMGHFSIDCEDFLAAKAYFVQLMLERGFLASNLFYAMYAHSFEQARAYLRAVDESFGLMAEALENGDLPNRLVGLPSSEGFKRLN